MNYIILPYNGSVFFKSNMKKPVLILQNISREGPGLLQTVLNERRIPFVLIDLTKNQDMPDITEYAAVVMLGGPQSANDTNQTMQTKIKCVQRVLEFEIPYLGICLGMQVLVKAAAGVVRKNAISEIGFRDPSDQYFQINLTSAGKEDALFLGLGDHFPVFHLHGETVELTQNMKLLGTGEYCRNQIVKVRKSSYGIQCHFELTPEMFDLWLLEDPELQEKDLLKLKKDFSQLEEQYTATGKMLFNNFLDIADITA